ncbi:MAG TPA: hypothetical protein ENK95_03910 [Campylobacterales bacterium]|nr:hypothetical protein [Campylobacterales bacterium]
MKLTNTALALLTALFLVGCGNSSTEEKLNLPDGKTLIFFDNASSKQYLYDTTEDKSEDMNADSTKNYNMTNKNGKLYVWNHEISEGKYEEKIVMLKDDYTIGSTLTYENFHYLGHFHEEDNKHVFAAHASSEFDPVSSSVAKKNALVALNKSLSEHADVKKEIAEVLPSGEELCNFFVLGEDDHDHAKTSNKTEEETAAHLALTKTGKMYIFKEDNVTKKLTESQSAFSIEGITACEEDKVSIIKNDDHGVLLFSAESQILYLIDSHGEDFHQHSKWTGSKFLPTGFTPTQLAGISESDEQHADH